MHPRTAGTYRPWWYIVGTLLWSWTLWGGAILVGGEWLAPAAVALFVLGGLGPLVVATVLVAAGAAHEGPGAFWRRAFDPRTLAPRWWAVVLALAIVPAVVVHLAGQAPGGVTRAGPIGFLVVGALAGAAEEPGWRGYAQEGFQQRRSVLSASVIVGAFWALWHLPLFWLAGSYQDGLGVATEEFWLFFAAILVGTVLYGWLYNVAGRATVAAVAYHALVNVAGEVFPAGDSARLALVVQILVAAAVVAGSWRWLITLPGPQGVVSDGRAGGSPLCADGPVDLRLADGDEGRDDIVGQGPVG